MVNIKNFAKNDGTDWGAYREAQVKAGEICCKCGRYLVFNKTGCQTICNSCVAVQDSKETVRHDKYIRCPKCNTTFEAQIFLDFDIYEEGDHDVDCPECGYFFIVETSVTYTFASPAVVDEIEDDSDSEIECTEEE